MQIEQKRKQTRKRRRRSPRQYLLDRLGYENAKMARRLCGLDAWETCIDFGYYVR